MLLTLKRLESTDHGTIGVLSAGDFSCYSMEPPWRDNLPNNFRISTGKYHCLWHRSPRYGWVDLIGNVEDRSHILIHSGNVGGDLEKGLHTHILAAYSLAQSGGSSSSMVKGRRLPSYPIRHAGNFLNIWKSNHLNWRCNHGTDPFYLAGRRNWITRNRCLWSS